jgi:Na+-translocating ferredoxin:NAD+ oxidoreductase subunit B
MTGIIIILVLTTFIVMLIYKEKQFTVDDKADLIRKIDGLLPQTQCGKCNFSGCRPYAEAIISNASDINQCPPGGSYTIRNLANLLGREIKSLNPENRLEDFKMVACIDEDLCIGCVKCIHACPVDAIVGTAKHMHTIITQECTGCELCVEPCPVDCIHMLVITQGGQHIRTDKNIPSNKMFQ